ncbi:tetratricopeptide repeat protein [Deminuibacter soli]|uniref:Tetratricopeptide repeat protein n=1 Tax=Deminuibacter soli TaxID=2291815 RepID=A0A3E1NNV9_9BACT|nr:tetratricopeptide repeat protein [Deminuibacter soli]RFM29621.1 tetratricopeptide repeat protein [Deminuibacter soli]
MKKTALTLLALAFTSAIAFAQSVDDGIKFLYYEKNKSAKEVLQKLVNDKPKDAYAIYWLGQAFIQDKDYNAAKALYQKALTDGVNDPWIWVGSGEVELLTGGDINSAKQKFEQAITATTATKGKTKGQPDPAILNAIGRANAAGSGKQGDPAYGIEKLKKAAELDPKNPDIFINMGILYLKQGGEKGGDAVEAYREATVRDPKYAKAYYRTGLIYQSQNNKEAMDKWFGDAVTADATYAPVYLAYFNYYSDKDVNAAKEFLDKYIANADKDCATDFYMADYLFRAGKYQESINKAKEMEAGACKDYKPISLVYAMDYGRVGDTAQAKTYWDKYLTSEDSAKIPLDAYKGAGNFLKHVKGSEQNAITYLLKAQALDTVKANQMSYYDSIASAYKAMNMPAERYDYLKKSAAINPKMSNADIFNLGTAAMDAKDYTVADSMFAIYREKYPDQALGYSLAVKSAQAADTTGAKAVGPINDYITFLSKDTVKNKQIIGYYHAILGGYYANTAKDVDQAIAEFEKAVAMDPTNTQYPAYLAQLQKFKQKANAPKGGSNGGGSKGSNGGSKAGGGKSSK